MNRPTFNIQEAYALNMALAAENALPQLIKTPLPYPKFNLVYQIPPVIKEDITPVLCFQTVEFATSLFAEINTWIGNKNLAWLSSTAFQTSSSGWLAGEQHLPEGFIPRINSVLLSSDRSFENVAFTLESVAMFAIHLMHCKNVNYTEYDPNKGIPWRNKHCGNKKAKPPFLKYKILQINPLGHLERERERTKESAANVQRVHTVRGHFKTYTAENPLFGRYTGTFWWGDCVKGNPEFGLIEKDYQLKIDSHWLEKLRTQKKE